MSSNDEPLRDPGPAPDRPTAHARLHLAVVNMPEDLGRSEAAERDDDFYDEVRDAVGGGTRSLLLGTSRRSIKRAIDQIETAQSPERPG